jgi:hypothetical protein
VIQILAVTEMTFKFSFKYVYKKHNAVNMNRNKIRKSLVVCNMMCKNIYVAQFSIRTAAASNQMLSDFNGMNTGKR